MSLVDKQKHFLKLLIQNEGYTANQLVDSYNLGLISDEVFKYGLKTLGFKEQNGRDEIHI